MFNEDVNTAEATEEVLGDTGAEVSEDTDSESESDEE